MVTFNFLSDILDNDNARTFFGLAFLSGIKLASMVSIWNKKRKQAELKGKVTALYIYPIKSCKAISVEDATITVLGLAKGDLKDRTFMFVRESDGKYVDHHMEPRLTLVHPSVEGNTMILTAPGMTALNVPLKPEIDSGRFIKCNVVGEECIGMDCGDAAAKWIEQLLGNQYRLVYSPPNKDRRRLLEINRTKFHQLTLPHDEVTFAQFAPYMLTTEETMTDLNSLLTTHVDVRRFRPNIVLSGSPALAENEWGNVLINEEHIRLRAIKPCKRCALINVDPDTGATDNENEPLKTLNKFRKVEWVSKDFGTLGIHLFADTCGKIKIGDRVYATLRGISRPI